ncbi:hypothetical protein [uncultured Imperialibacter sp.]|uniref:hypothetical protein n=1 Tax=uncultured Imperialibacter sp. TaxID=1672639 RepID=UPI0030DAC576|tara:strand:+ start:772 stop:936 length:165 start_codon:yes stop_codon:yes gene_type:complete
MKAEVKTEKGLDAVALQHKIRIDLGKKISAMSHEEEIDFFKKAAERAKKRRAAR